MVVSENGSEVRGVRTLSEGRAPGEPAAAWPSSAPPRDGNPGPSPLSFQQARMWFLAQLEPESAAYHSGRLTRWLGPLDVERLKRSLAEVVRRHEALRTRFPAFDGIPAQEALPPGQFQLPVVDIGAMPAWQAETKAQQWAAEEFRRPFDLTAEAPFRAGLLRLGPEEHLLALVAHHVLIDGWSMGILLGEAAVLYSSYTSGRPSPLPELPVQYRDYARWQRERLQGEVLEGELAYWRDRLSGAPPVLELPADRPRRSPQSHEGGQVSFVVPEDLLEGVIALSRRERATPFMTLLAAFKVLLSRWSGQTDVVVGTPIAGRMRREHEALIGYFANTLALRTDCSSDPTFKELLARVREATLGCFDHQELPFEKLVDHLQLARSLNHHPLFQVLFNYRNYPVQPMDAALLRVEDVQVERETAKFDLDLSLLKEAGGLRGVLTYSLALFDPESASHMAEQLQMLLQQIVQSPGSPISAYSLLTERSSVVLPDPRAALDATVYPTVPEMVARVVEAAPARPAVRQGARSWNYGELAASAEKLAQALSTRGVTRGTVVAITGQPSFGLVAGMLAILRSGGVLLPIAADLPERRKRLMLRETDATYLLQVGEAGATDVWTGDLTAVTVFRVEAHPGGTEPEEASSIASGTVALPTPDPADPAYIFFTSGTTGIPKAVQGVHNGLSHFLAWQRAAFGIGSSDRCAQLTNISFDVVLRDVFLGLTSGATLCLPPDDLAPDQVLAWVASEGATVLHAVPSLAQVWLEHPSPAGSLQSLRWVFFAGEPLTDTLVREWRDAVPEECGIVNLYGPTETTLAKFCYRVPKQIPPGVQRVGQPLPGAQALVMNERQQLCGVNEPGEIVMRTPFRTRGYINAIDEQRQRFITNPFTGERSDVLYRTGDLGRYCSDGNLLVMGRLDQQVKVRGVRIEPGEVTAVLAEHPEVQACAVVARQAGRDGIALVAYVVPSRDGVLASALRAFLTERLPAAFAPSAFVFLTQLPLTPNGKLDHRALPAPEQGAGISQQAYVAPRTPVEEMLAAIWAEVLGARQVGVHDDFFALGGHSLRAAQVMARARAAFQLELPMRSLFEAPTVAGLAVAVTRRLIEEMGDQP